MNKPKKVWLACLLSLLAPGLGQVYCGYFKRGFKLFIAYLVVVAVAAVLVMFTPVAFLNLLLYPALVTATYIVIFVDAVRLTNPSRANPSRYGRWYMLIIAFVVARMAMGCMVIFLRFMVAEPYKLPSVSMEDTLLRNDFFFANRMVYRFVKPYRNDIVVFQSPLLDKVNSIKRCVAIPTDTVEIKNGQLYINGKPQPLAGKAKYTASQTDESIPVRDHFASLRVLARGDTLRISRENIRGFFFARNVIVQENPNADVRVELQLYIDGAYKNDQEFSLHLPCSRNEYPIPISFDLINQDLNAKGPVISAIGAKLEWYDIQAFLNEIRKQNPDRTVVLKKLLHLDGTVVDQYTLQDDTYFVLGDNRDNARDSRHWGLVSRNAISGRVGVIYLSLSGKRPWWRLSKSIRSHRIGKIVKR